MNDLISIVVPIYNVENFLHRCVDSILNQTYKNLEIILVNDGSTDKCGDICEAYAKLDSRIKIIHKENGGLSDARNVGMEMSSGEYIGFIDSDDWVHEVYIEKLYELLKSTNSDISVCNFLMTSTENFPRDNLTNKTFTYSNLEALEQLHGEFYVQMVTAWGKLYKKELFEGISFPIGRLHEDEFTTYKLLYKAKTVVLTTAQLLYYWQREDSIMGNRHHLKNQLDRIDALQERAAFLGNLSLKELYNKTNRMIFFSYRSILQDKKAVLNEVIKENIYRDFIGFKERLRESKQSLLFKFFYELYFLAPKPMDIIYEIYSSKRWNKKYA